MIELCHSSCALQDGGTLESYLAKVKAWVVENPTEVITILWVNSDSMPVSNWAAAYESTGLSNYSYVPAASTYTTSADQVTAWPTLQTLINTRKTVINFITSQADHATAPYILGEWPNIWETPYDNTSPANFTCPLDRGTRPNLLYLANHFAYTETTFLGATIDTPNTDDIDQTNSLSSMQAHGNLCAGLNSRYPNFFLVDFYERGSGGALEAVAAMNGITYVAQKLGDGITANAIQTFFGGENEIRNIAIFVGAAVLSLIILWVGICCCCRRRARKLKQSQDEDFLKPSQAPSFTTLEPVKSFATTFSQPKYAPVADEHEMYDRTKAGTFDTRSRSDSQASLMQNTAFNNIRGQSRPLPTQPSYTSYASIRDQYRVPLHGHDRQYPDHRNYGY